MKISKKTAPHAVWQGQCDAWHLVDRDHLSIKHEHMPAGTAETAHCHARSRQFFFVLSGVLDMVIGEATHRLEAQEGIEIDPGLRHQARNSGNSPTEFLVISSPSTEGDREA